MVLEFRFDPTKGGRVIIANERSKRPTVFGGRRASCPFDREVEGSTPPTKFACPDAKQWKARVFDNAFALLKKEKPFDAAAFSSRNASYAYGDHEVIVETDVHDKTFHEFSEYELKCVFEAYKDRLVELERDENAKCVLLFKNHGRNAGASIEHEHAQIVSLPFVPEIQERERKAFEDYKKNSGACIYCDLMQKEKKNILLENSDFIALCPSFSRFAFEVWILPKKHAARMTDFDEKPAALFMEALQECIRRVFHVVRDYNVVFHNALKGERDFHFHAEIYPRSGWWAGLELGAGVIANVKSEEDALKTLKAVHSREEEVRTRKGFSEGVEGRDLY